MPSATLVVFQGVLAEAALAEATTAPSTRRSTRDTPTLSDAWADTVTVPATRWPPAGAVTDTVGAVVSPGAGAPQRLSENFLISEASRALLAMLKLGR